MYQQVLDFWFDETNSTKWFVKDPEFDKELTKRFKDLVLSAAAGECYSWRTNAYGRLAEIIVLDQMSRNIFRDTPAAFAQDAMALTLAQEAVAAGLLDQFERSEEHTSELQSRPHLVCRLLL